MSARPSMASAEYKLRSYRNLDSFLHSANELSKIDNDIEKPTKSTRCVDIDGRKVIMTLVKNETKPPPSSKKKREERMHIHWTMKNVQRRDPCREKKLRRYLMRFNTPALTAMFLVAFVLMNAIFAGFWFIEESRCCEDATMTFAEVFDFAVQTSATIGYGGYWPRGYWNNALVVLLSTMAILLSTVYAGLLFFKFILPEANIQFSEVITMSNVMGEPCLEIRVGNVDGSSNKLINAEANLRVISIQEYFCESENRVRRLSHPEDLKLAVSTHHMFFGVWTLRHFINEDSPLYGFRFDEFPGNTIRQFELNIKAIQTLTKGEVYAQTAYKVSDVLVGHRFEDQAKWEEDIRTGIFDYAKMSSTKPSSVWYPQRSNALQDDGNVVIST